MSTLSGSGAPEEPQPPKLDLAPALDEAVVMAALEEEDEDDTGGDVEAQVASKAAVKGGMLVKSQLVGASHSRFFEIRDNQLFWYIEAPSPAIVFAKNFRGSFHLKGWTMKLAEGKKPELTLNPPPKSSEKSISLRGTTEELNDWKQALTTAIAASDAVETVVKQRSSLATRWKKGIGQKISQTQAVQNALPPAVSMIINCIGRVVVGYSKDEAKGKEIINNMIKIVWKLYFVMDEGKATMHDLVPLDKHLRAALLLIANFWSPFKKKVAKGVPQLTPKEMSVAAGVKLNELNEAFCSWMQPFVSDKSVATINYTLSYLSNPDLLLFATTEPGLADLRISMASEIDNYLAFESWD